MRQQAPPPNGASEDDFLTVLEAAAKLRRSPRFVLEELRQKRLRGAKIGSAWSIDRDDLETYIQSRMNMSRVRRSA